MTDGNLSSNWRCYILTLGNSISEYKKILGYVPNATYVMILDATLCVIVKIWKLMSINKVDMLDGYKSHNKLFL